MSKKIAFIFDIPKNPKRDKTILEQYVAPNINYDIFYLTNNPDLTKLLVKDIDLDINSIKDNYFFIVCVGSEVFKKYIKHKGGISKYHAHLIREPFNCIPIMHPNIVFLNPTQKDNVKKGFDVIAKTWEYTTLDSEPVSTNYKTVATPQEFKALVSKLQQANLVAYDLETTSLDPFEGDIIGAAFSAKAHTGYFVPYNILEQCKDDLQKLFNNTTIVMHNAKFDKKWTYAKLKLRIDKFHDTMILHYLLINQNKNTHSLKLLAMEYSDLGDYSRELDEYIKTFCRKAKIRMETFHYGMIPIEILAPYACSDVDATLQLMHNMGRPAYQKASTLTKKCYYDIMLPATDTLMELELCGAPVDKDYLLELDRLYTEEINQINKTIKSIPEVAMLEADQGSEFNPNSYRQIGRLLFEFIGLPSQGKTPSGANKTNAEVLEKLSNKHDLPKLILKLRAAVKMHGTYVTNILKGISANGRMRGNFNLCVAKSGRLSSSEEAG